MQVREATPADAEQIAKVYVASWRQGYAGHFPEEFLAGLKVEPVAERWCTALKTPSPGSIALVSTDDAGVTGVVLCGPTRETSLDASSWAEVVMLYVAPPAWGQGAGHTLLSRAVGALRSAGFADVHRWALDGNERAERLYARSGWAKTSQRRVDASRGFEIAEALWTSSLGL